MSSKKTKLPKRLLEAQKLLEGKYKFGVFRGKASMYKKTSFRGGGRGKETQKDLQ